MIPKYTVLILAKGLVSINNSHIKVFLNVCIKWMHISLTCLDTQDVHYDYIYSSGVKFIVIADKQQQKVSELLRKIYELYTDYVLKNPFYSLDMPIKLVNLYLILILPVFPPKWWYHDPLVLLLHPFNFNV